MLSTNRTVLVTGASGGIGSALCRKLAAQGTRVLLTCVDRGRLSELHAELGAPHESVAADLSTAEGRDKVVALCVAAGGIDAVVNLAGILDFHLFVDQEPAMVERLLRVNTLAPILLTQQLLPLLLTRREARIVNVGSIFGSIGHPGFAVYCASKAAIKSFSEALARELADTGVSVGYIAPRATRTPLNSERVQGLNKALGTREDAPEHVADVLCRMLSSKQRQRFLGWPEKLFVLINAVVPALVHRALVGKLSVVKKFAKS